MNLKEAQKSKKKLEQFIKERQQEIGDQEQFDKAISSMVGKSKEAQEASYQDKSES